MLVPWGARNEKYWFDSSKSIFHQKHWVWVLGQKLYSTKSICLRGAKVQTTLRQAWRNLVQEKQRLRHHWTWKNLEPSYFNQIDKIQKICFLTFVDYVHETLTFDNRPDNNKNIQLTIMINDDNGRPFSHPFHLWGLAAKGKTVMDWVGMVEDKQYL